MYIVSLSNQTFLFTNSTERFTLDGREVAPKAPEWMMKNHYALKLREEGKISFEIKKKRTQKEELQDKCKELGIQVGDNASIATMEKSILAKEKELEDAEK